MQGKIELDLISKADSMSFVGDFITLGEDGALGIEIMENRDWFWEATYVAYIWVIQEYFC
jgi:hypothetical protein